MKLPISITVICGTSLRGSDTRVSRQSSATINAIRKAIQKTEEQLEDNLSGRIEIDIKHDIVQGYKGFHQIHDSDLVHHITVWCPQDIYNDLDTNIKKELQ